MSMVWAILFFLSLFLFWGMTVIGMPGNWLIASAAAIYWLFAGSDGRLAVSGSVVAGLFVLAVVGEAMEFLASAMGVARKGGSRRSALLALAGAMIGGICGLFVGAPIPVVGSLIATLALASVGAMVGAMLGETHKGRTLREAWTIGHAAFWSRLYGTLAKTTVGAIMVAIASAALMLK